MHASDRTRIRPDSDRAREDGVLSLVSSVGACVLDWICPPRCPGCRIRLEAMPRTRHTQWCATCADTIFELTGPRCPGCARSRPTQIGRTYRGVDSLCGRCQSNPPAFSGTRSLFEYAGAIADAIQYAKYAPAAWPLRTLGPRFVPWVSDQLSLIDDDAVVTTVPMHRSDLRSRGFHLTELLLRQAGAGGSTVTTEQLLRKRRPTRPQAGLTRGERLANVREVYEFRAGQPPTGRHVVVVDDVMTTGATADAISRVLLKAGASRVSVVTLARTMSDL